MEWERSAVPLMGQVIAFDSFTLPVRQPLLAYHQYLFKDTIGKDVPGTWDLSPVSSSLLGDTRKVTGQKLFLPLEKKDAMYHLHDLL